MFSCYCLGQSRTVASHLVLYSLYQSSPCRLPKSLHLRERGGQKTAVHIHVRTLSLSDVRKRMIFYSLKLNCRQCFMEYSCHTVKFLENQGWSVGLALYLCQSHRRSIFLRRSLGEWKRMVSRSLRPNPREIPRSIHLPARSATA